MKKITLLTLFIILICSSDLIAQKRALTHDDYDGWKSISSNQISNNGQWTFYTINPQLGDGLLEIKGLDNGSDYSIARAKNFKFSPSSNFVIARVSPEYQKVHDLNVAKTDKSKLPKDSLVILNLRSGEFNKMARVKSYKMASEESDWIAWLNEKPLKAVKKDKSDATETEVKEVKKPKSKSKGTELVLYNMASGVEHRWDGVMDYSISETGNFLYFEKDEADSLNPTAVFAFNTKKSELTTVHSGLANYDKMSIDKSGEQLAFLGTASETKEKIKYFNLMHWNEGNKTAIILADTVTAGMPNDWMVSNSANLNFSESGKRLFFGSKPRPIEYDYETDSTLLNDEKPDVDVWAWNDPYIQPMQKLNAGRDRNKSYTAVLDLKSKQMTQLGGMSLESIRVDYKSDFDFVVGMNDQPYRVQMTWDTQIPRDYYLVDVKTGVADPLLTTKGRPSVSPQGKYASWYNPEDRQWYMMDLESKTITNLTAGMSVNFYNELHDSPSLPNQYGSAGWTEGDKGFLIYDRYDIWKFDPSGKNQPLNITNGFGRENDLTLRYSRLDRDQNSIPAKGTLLLTAFHNWSKQSGYYTGSHNRAAAPKKVIMDDFSFYGLSKAKDADRVVLRKSSHTLSPEVWTASDYYLKDIKVLSNVGQQLDNIKRGSAELLEFNSLEDGEKMQAILYKPENFDPNKKYPMLVYFYERRSNSLHNHMNPAPSRSTINIPYFISNDYIVLVPDIKYELGYPGPSAYNHIIPAVNAAVNLGFVDKEKMAIQGQSWGGYQVAYLVTKTDMFAAAGAGAPVVNMTSAYGGIRWGSGMSRMFQYEKTQSRLGGTLWDKSSRYIDNSPLFRADEITTPLFIMHNDKDTAVPWYQGIEFYMSLRRLQKPAWMVVYNDEGHNLSKRKNSKDLSIRMGQFFDHYLKGAPAPVWMVQGLPATLKGRTLRYELAEDAPEKVQGTGQSLIKEKTEKKGSKK